MEHLRVKSLGNVCLELNGNALEQTLSRKALALFVYIACNRKRYLRSELASVLWSEISEERALGNLRLLLNRLPPQILPALEITRQTIGFSSVVQLQVDSQEFENSLQLSLKEAEVGNRISAARLEKALLLYHGDFLQGFFLPGAISFNEWQLFEQERLQQLALLGFYQIASFHYRQGNYQASLEYTARLLQFDSLLETGHRLYMQILAVTGHRSSAVKHYEEFQRQLRAELTLEPELETTSLYNELLSGNEIISKAEILPHTLRFSPHADIRIEALKKVSLFAHTPVETLEELGKLMKQEMITAGNLIFSQGDPGYCFYLIMQGQVRIYVEKHTLSLLGPGDFFGEMALLEETPRSASATVLQDAVLLRLDREDFQALIMAQPEILWGIIRVIMTRLKARSDEVIKLKGLLSAASL